MPAEMRQLKGLADVHRAAQACFAPTGRRRIGLELEFHSESRQHPGRRVPISLLQSLQADTPLPAGGRVTIEPGGQIEVNTAPVIGIDTVCKAAEIDVAAVHRAAAQRGIELSAAGADGSRRPHRVVTEVRYPAMEKYFDQAWPSGRVMMCNTAALQINLDLGDETTAQARWDVCRSMGPAMMAAFANSPILEKRATGFKSSRMHAWWQLDPSRTAPVPDGDGPVDAWARYALGANVMLIRSDRDTYVPMPDGFTFEHWMREGHELGWPTADDLDYHLSTLFPPVRPRGWLELRMIDMVPAPYWRVATAVISSLTFDDEARAETMEITEQSAGLWVEASHLGPEHPLLAEAATRCFEAAIAAMPRVGASDRTVTLVTDFMRRYPAAGRCPADDALEVARR